VALLTNGKSDGGYLAVELTVDKRLEPALPFARGPVVSWQASDEVLESLQEAVDEMEEEWDEPESDWPPSGEDWPPIEKGKAGWLVCTIRFVVGTVVIFQQSLLVQYITIWEWYYTLKSLTATQHSEERFLHSGGESPELHMHLTRSYYDPEEWNEEPGTPGYYYYSLLIHVDTGIAAGSGFDVSGEGPGMYLLPSEEEALAFAWQLLTEADEAG
jgi:hypothetical protein